MKDLIERLEKATGPDRQLDIAILKATDANGYRIEDDGTILVSGDMGDGPGWFNIGYDVPAYTASLDAALTLVPEGWTWMVSNRAPEPHAGRAYLNNRETHFTGIAAAPNPRFRATENTASTPAIALCIAVLKARASLPAQDTPREGAVNIHQCGEKT